MIIGVSSCSVGILGVQVGKMGNQVGIFGPQVGKIPLQVGIDKIWKFSRRDPPKKCHPQKSGKG
ncbi:hypothetical protein [Paenisporosarcina sp. TG20]|uniref:hypothetical protein n=1 Tax=Paenisporosarcina sp. TG20 TaxID=1211706 RepID=UPI00030F74D8|nr:hypothetical protein [Paenisporosarcina sp. TG20]